MSGKVTNWVAENWKWILAILTSMAVSYAEYTEMKATVDRTEKRLTNYIDRFNKHKDEAERVNKERLVEIAVLKEKVKQLSE